MHSNETERRERSLCIVFFLHLVDKCIEINRRQLKLSFTFFPFIRIRTKQNPPLPCHGIPLETWRGCARRGRVFCRVEVGPIRNQRSQLGNMSIPWGGVNRRDAEGVRIRIWPAIYTLDPSRTVDGQERRRRGRERCVSDGIKAPGNASAGPDPTNRTITDQKVIWCFI